MVLALVISGVGIIPVWLVGALAVEINRDVPMNEANVGMLVGVFMVVTALSSVPAGRVVQRIGWTWGMMAVGLFGMFANLGIALFAHSLVTFALFLAMAGAGNAFAQPAANLCLVQSISWQHQGTAFGIKQAGVPGATLIAGFAVPSMGMILGWRWTFVFIAAICAASFASLLRRLTSRPQTRWSMRRKIKGGIGTNNYKALFMLSLGGALATAASTSLGVFLVVYAVRLGVSIYGAGVLLAGVSAVNIATRLAVGRLADRYQSNHLLAAALMMLIGALGYVILAGSSDALMLIIGATCSFAGWGWNSLFHLATVRAFREHAATATGIATASMFGGASVGPIVFGLLVQGASFQRAWVMASVVAFFGAISILFAYRQLRFPS